MFRIIRLNVLTVICVVLANAQIAPKAEAAQWPVNAGPINQAVPQYRARYPLSTSPAPKPTPQPVQNLRRVEPTFDSITSDPIEQLNGDSFQTLNTRQTAPKPIESFDQPETTSSLRYPLSEPATVKVQPSKPLSQPKLVTSKKKAPPKKAAAKKTAAKKPTVKKDKLAPPAINYDIYRDRNPLPIDPRKPNGICTTANGHRGCACGQGCDCGRGCDAPGLHGKPYQEREPGGSRCGDKKCGKCSPMFSQYWPRPFSAKLDEHFPDQAAARYYPCQKKRIVDVFDKFTDFKLINYQRTDNGYYGEDSDPYGCLGESRMIASGVAGVGFRFPSVPVDRSASLPADRSAARESFWY